MNDIPLANAVYVKLAFILTANVAAIMSEIISAPWASVLV